jgi:acetyltransferase/esterase
VSVLEVPGARLYYEIHGHGPLLIMVPGASGVSDSFRMVATHLAVNYTVALYDGADFLEASSRGRRTTGIDCRPTPMICAD